MARNLGDRLLKVLTTTLLVVAALASSVAVLRAGDPDAERIRTAAARGISLIQSSQRIWLQKQTCSSCHHQFQPAIAFRSAHEHGIPFDEALARNHAIEVLQNMPFQYSSLDTSVQYNHVLEPAMADAYSMVAADALGVRPNIVLATRARMIAARQSKGGDWNSFHGRPPSSYSGFTMTALAIRAISLYHHPSQAADTKARVTRAQEWLSSHRPRDTEERTFLLLGLHWAGADRVRLERAARALKGTQQPDGGWNSLDGLASEAYSTGQVLVALHDTNQLSISDRVWNRGIDFLLKTQAEDGSWHVTSRLNTLPVSPPYFDSGYPYGHDQFISVHGAAWAVMALARALGPANVPQQAALPVKLEDIPSWAETVLFGSAPDLKRLLDEGFDPNSATSIGGTTALMMAVPDLAKMKLLLDRGANINARAKTKYSALMVAAQHRDSTPAIQLLLKHGAEVRMPVGQGVPQLNAHPFILAAYAGNTEVLRTLRDGGESVDEKMVLAGIVDWTPLMGATMQGERAVVRTLLDLGARVEQPNLTFGVLGNHVEIVQMLISHGANVNHVDELGMTPLLYAASIDFGDSEMIRLLLKSGARRDLRNKDGLTALELARKYNHQHLVPRLEE